MIASPPYSITKLAEWLIWDTKRRHNTNNYLCTYNELLYYSHFEFLSSSWMSHVSLSPLFSISYCQVLCSFRSPGFSQARCFRYVYPERNSVRMLISCINGVENCFAYCLSYLWFNVSTLCAHSNIHFKMIFVLFVETESVFTTFITANNYRLTYSNYILSSKSSFCHNFELFANLGLFEQCLFVI